MVKSCTSLIPQTGVSLPNQETQAWWRSLLWRLELAYILLWDPDSQCDHAKPLITGTMWARAVPGHRSILSQRPSQGGSFQSLMNDHYTVNKCGLTCLIKHQATWAKEHTEKKKVLQSPNWIHQQQSVSRTAPYLELSVSLFPLLQSQLPGTKAQAQAQAQASNAYLATSDHLQSRKGRVKQPGFLLKAASRVPINLQWCVAHIASKSSHQI